MLKGCSAKTDGSVDKIPISREERNIFLSETMRICFKMAQMSDLMDSCCFVVRCGFWFVGPHLLTSDLTTLAKSVPVVDQLKVSGRF